MLGNGNPLLLSAQDEAEEEEILYFIPDMGTNFLNLTSVVLLR